ncbi:MAG: hypothetical protein KAI03_05555 [Candidatus Aureabacteria bacterium]|nr:hypothetical protein [Candidatus Auribacterota bacterium]
MRRRYIKIINLLLYCVGFFLALSYCRGVDAAEAKQQNYSWEFAGWYGGGAYPAVVPDPNIKGRVYLLSDVTGLWRSDNKGEKWYFINEGLVNLHIAVLAIAPSNSNVIYIGTKDGIMRSDNGGKTWRYLESMKGKINFLRPGNYRSIVVDPHDYNKVYVGTNRGTVLFSKNGGKIWRYFGGVWRFLGWHKYPFGKRVPITALHLTRDGGKLFAASELGLKYYDFKRKKWIKSEIGHEKVWDMVSLAQSEALYVTAGKQVAYSFDQGKTWQFTSAIPRGEVIRLAVREDNSGNVELLAGWKKNWHGGVFLSSDNGKTWKDIEKNLKHDKNLNPTRVWKKDFGKPNSVAFDVFDPETLYFTDGWGVWRSDDKGETWSEKINGSPNTVGSDIHITTLGEIYVATMDNGLLKSTDGGKNYKPVFPQKGYRKGVNGHVWRVVTNPKNPKHIIATSSPWDVDFNQVIISRDGGMNFIAVRDGLPARRPKVNTMWKEGYPKALALDPKEPNIVYLGIDGDDGGGLYISRDAGWHWEYSEGQPGSKRIYNALAVDPTNSHRLFWGAYGKRGGVYVSENRGKTWKRVFKKTTYVFDMAVNPEGWIYVTGSLNGPVIFVSKDHGKSWSLLTRFPGEGTVDAMFIHPENPDRIGAGIVQWNGKTGGKIYWSNNKGQNWSEITGDIPYGRGVAAMAYNPKDFHIYITRYAGSVYKTKL